jgi:DNA-binding NarL/FixJ family response regulator
VVRESRIAFFPLREKEAAMGEASIRLVIADDQALFREGLRLLLRREGSIEVVGEAVNGAQLIETVRTLQPDILLLNFQMPGVDGLEVVLVIKEASPATKVLLLPDARDEALILKALKAGVKGYLSMGASGSDLLKAIQAVHHGELWVERRLMAGLLEGEGFTDLRPEEQHPRVKELLTAREREILRVVASGSTNKETAQALFISEKTVRSHLNSIFKKLQVTRRVQATLYAIRRGLN